MNSFATFLAALSDPLRLRLLFLVQEHKITIAELSAVLGLGETDLAPHVKQLAAANLIKTGKNGTLLKLKHRHAALLGRLFTHFKAGGKADTLSRVDEKRLHELRHPKAAKKTKKPAAKKKGAKKK